MVPALLSVLFILFFFSICVVMLALWSPSGAVKHFLTFLFSVVYINRCFGIIELILSNSKNRLLPRSTLEGASIIAYNSYIHESTR